MSEKGTPKSKCAHISIVTYWNHPPSPLPQDLHISFHASWVLKCTSKLTVEKSVNHHLHGVFADWLRLNNIKAPVMGFGPPHGRMCEAQSGYTPVVVLEWVWGGLESLGSFPPCVGLALENTPGLPLHCLTSWQDPDQTRAPSGSEKMNSVLMVIPPRISIRVEHIDIEG